MICYLQTSAVIFWHFFCAALTWYYIQDKLHRCQDSLSCKLRVGTFYFLNRIHHICILMNSGKDRLFQVDEMICKCDFAVFVVCFFVSLGPWAYSCSKKGRLSAQGPCLPSHTHLHHNQYCHTHLLRGLGHQHNNRPNEIFVLTFVAIQTPEMSK